MKLFKDLSEDAQVALFKAWLRGAAVETYNPDIEEWHEPPVPIWDGLSRGTRDMMNRAKNAGLRLIVERY